MSFTPYYTRAGITEKLHWEKYFTDISEWSSNTFSRWRLHVHHTALSLSAFSFMYLQRDGKLERFTRGWIRKVLIREWQQLNVAGRMDGPACIRLTVVALQAASCAPGRIFWEHEVDVTKHLKSVSTTFNWVVNMNKYNISCRR